MKPLIRLFSFFIIVLASQGAMALFMFEPMVGYNRGQIQSTRAQGLGLGLRAGIDIKAFFVAADLGYHELSQGTLSSVKHNDTGVSFGGELKNFRIWYGIISSSTYTYKSGATDVKYSGTGTKLGIGAEVATNTYLNMELRTLDYTTVSNAGVESPINEIATLGFLSISWVL